MILGIDLGSRYVKLVVADKSGSTLMHRRYDTIKFYREFGEIKDRTLHLDFKKTEIDYEFDKIVSTGYGKNNLAIGGAAGIPEIKAHYLAAMKKSGLVNFTLLDIGGQDTKVIRVENGKMVDFFTNDKCAAGSGRYLENMAVILGITVEELAKHYEMPVTLSNTCAIFGESELIGKIVEGYSMDELCAGINMSVYKKIESHLKKYPQDNLVFSGGVANNDAIYKMCELYTGYNIIRDENPQYNGAFGCVIHGLGSL